MAVKKERSGPQRTEANQDWQERLFVGTSGWSYSHWKEFFYPKNVKPGQYLEYYTGHFDAVELNASFYRLPKLDIVKGWYKRTPQNFYFCPKLSRWITHVKKLHDPENTLKTFMDLFKVLKHKLGPILVQLPPTIPLDSPYVEPFFELLTTAYEQYRFAIEARNPTWITKEAYRMLAKHKLSWVIADSGGYYPEAKEITSDHVYLRFHGREDLYASNYSARELAPYAKLAASCLMQGKHVWAFFNNDALSYAVANAKLFRELTLAVVVSSR